MGKDFSLSTYKLYNATFDGGSWSSNELSQQKVTVDAWLIAGNFSRSFPVFMKGLQELKIWKVFSVLLKFILSNQTFSRVKILNLLLWKTGQTSSKKSDENLVSDYYWGHPVSVTVDSVFFSKSNSSREAKDKREDVTGYISIHKLSDVLVNYGREWRKNERALEREKMVYTSHIIRVICRKLISLAITKKFTEPMTEDCCAMTFSRGFSSVRRSETCAV